MKEAYSLFSENYRQNDEGLVLPISWPCLVEM